MADNKFFRGPNRMDWLFAVMLQTAADWYPDSQVKDVASILGEATVTRYVDGMGLFPTVLVVVTADYVFVVSASTRSSIQWVGNVLGSAAVAAPPAQGTLSAYFGACATFQYLATRPQVISKISGRRLVLIGFSLGGATATILKDMYQHADSIPSACIAFGNPRAGTTTFNADFPTTNYVGIGVINDPIPSVPPTIWAGLGIHNAWTPFPPFVTYDHVADGYCLRLGGDITEGYVEQSVSDVVLSFDVGTWLKFHNQCLYGNLLRSKNMPETIDDGYEGYANAGETDRLASQTLTFSGIDWRWYPTTTPTTTEEGANMTVQLTVGIRDREFPTAFDEVYFMSGNDPKAAVQRWTSAVSPATTLNSERAKFLTNKAEIYYVRGNLLGGERQSYLRKLKQPVPGVLGASETLGDGVFYYGYSQERKFKRQLMFRGVSGAWISGDKLTSQGDAQQNLVTQFIDKLISAGLQIMSNGSAIVGVHKIVACAKATQNDNLTLTLADNTQFSNGDLVKITGCRDAPLLNAIWKVGGTPTAGQFTLSGSARFSAPAVIAAKVKAYGPTPFTVDDYEFNSVGHKKCGRPRFLPRGKSAVKIRRR